MAEEIRGLNVKFDADFSEFKKNMKAADKDINSTQKQLKSLKDSLKIEWDEKKFKNAQDQARKAIEATEQKATLLRDRLEQIEAAGVTDKNRDEYNYLSEQLAKAELNAQKLNEELKDLERLNLDRLTQGFTKVSSALDTASQKTRGLSVASTALLTGMVAGGLKAVQYGDDIATLATKYDMTAEALQRFNYVALQTDTQAEDLYKAFVKVQGGVSDLKTGIESVSTKALAQLGLSFDTFSGSEEQFYAIIDALSKMEDRAKMVSLANDIFGEKMATNLFPLIYAGTDAINEYKDEFEELGFLTDEQVEKLAEFDNVLNKLKTRYTNVGISLGSAFLPVLENFADMLDNLNPKIQKFVGWFDKLSPNMKNFITYGLLAMAVLSPMLSAFSKIVGIIPALITGLSGINTAFSAISKHPIVLILGVIAGLLVLLYARNEEFRESMNRLIDVLNESAIPVFDFLYKLVRSIFDLLGPLIDALGNGLAPVLELICTILEPIVGLLEQIFKLINLIIDGILFLVGKGWAWGTEEEGKNSTSGKYYSSDIDIDSILDDIKNSFPDYPDTPSNPSNTYVDNSNIVVNIQKNDYMSEEDIINAVNKGLRLAHQSRV